MKENNETSPVLVFGQNKNRIQSKDYEAKKPQSIVYLGKTYQIYSNTAEVIIDYDYSGVQVQDGQSYFRTKPSATNKLLANTYIAVANNSSGLLDIYKASRQGDSFRIESTDKLSFNKDKYYSVESNASSIEGVVGNVYKAYQITKQDFQTQILGQFKVQYGSSTTSGKGLLIDLDDGIINGYDMYLKATSNNGSIILDSTNVNTPFYINDKNGKTTFSTKWDGTLFCNKVQSLNNDGRDWMSISIGNSFYVTSSGSAGGGTWGGGCSGSSTGVVGYSAQPISSFTALGY